MEPRESPAETTTKPLLPVPATPTLSAKKWSPGSWQDATRQSAFQPYKQPCTVLTNLQRGNTQADTPAPQPKDVNFHTRAGQGEITERDVAEEKSVDVCDNSGLTALHWASAYGQTNSVQLLLESGADVDNPGPDGETALLLAAHGGHHDVLRLLVGNGAQVNKVDDVGNSALMYAASSNHPHCCNELLLNGAEFTLENLCGNTAYDLAVLNNSSLAKALMENHLLAVLQN